MGASRTAILSTADQLEIEFKPKNGDEGDIGSVAGMVTKPNEKAKAVPIIADPVQAERNRFFLEFTNNEAARQQNLKLLRDQNLLDILFVHKDGRRGAISLTKGASGTGVVNQALASWFRTLTRSTRSRYQILTAIN